MMAVCARCGIEREQTDMATQTIPRGTSTEAEPDMETRYYCHPWDAVTPTCYMLAVMEGVW